MGVIDNAVTRALEIAADDSHGYDQANRWGPDYDCSSLVISAFKKAGVPLSCTYTGNMRGDMLRCGFEDVTGSVDLSTGAGLERGDVLLNHVHHTALYIGGGQLVQASINEYGTTTGGRTGDQTGREIYTRILQLSVGLRTALHRGRTGHGAGHKEADTLCHCRAAHAGGRPDRRGCCDASGGLEVSWL